MAINPYNPSSEKIIYKTKVEFVKRFVNQTIYLIKNDSNNPLLEIQLYNNYEKYYIPNEIQYVKLRFNKNDGTYILLNTLGHKQNDRSIIYFEINQQLSSKEGFYTPIIELIINNNKVGSSPIYLQFNENQNGGL